MRVAHFRSALPALSETFIEHSVRQHAALGVETLALAQKAGGPLVAPRLKFRAVPWRNPLFSAARLALLPYRGILRRRHRRAAWAEGEHILPLLRAWLRHELRRWGPDLVHAHFGDDAWRVLPVAREMSIPLVASFYGHDVGRLPTLGDWEHRLREVYDYAGVIRVLSHSMGDELVRRGADPSKIRVVHLSVDVPKHFHREAPAAGVSKFISVGRLVEKKGHDDAIRAVSLLRSRGVLASLDIVGDGPLRSELESQVAAQGLQEQVRFHGALPHEAVLSFMRRFDAFLMCSKTSRTGDAEGTPTVLVEAQAVGLPVVATDHAGIPEMIPVLGHRLLAPEGDFEEIASRMHRLMEMTREQVAALTASGGRHVAAEFGLQETTRQLVDLYATLVQAPGDDIR